MRSTLPTSITYLANRSAIQAELSRIAHFYILMYELGGFLETEGSIFLISYSVLWLPTFQAISLPLSWIPNQLFLPHMLLHISPVGRLPPSSGFQESEPPKNQSEDGSYSFRFKGRRECLNDIVRICGLGMRCRSVSLELGKWSQDDKEVKAEHS